MDPVQLARELSEALAPALPVLVTAGNTATEIVTSRALTALERWAVPVWQALRRQRTTQSNALEVAARDLAKNPADQAALATLQFQLRKLIEANPALGRELEELLQEGRRHGVLVAATGTRSVAAGGNITHSTVVTGDQNTLR